MMPTYRKFNVKYLQLLEAYLYENNCDSLEKDCMQLFI